MTPEGTILMVAGGLLISLGLLVGMLRYRNATALSFAAFSAGLGGSYLIFGGSTPTSLPAPAWMYWSSAYLAAAGLWGLFLLMPHRIKSNETRDAWIAGSVGVAAAIAFNVIAWTVDENYFTESARIGSVDAAIYRIAGFIVNAGANAALLMFALRLRRLPDADTTAARTMGILAAGVYLFAGNSVRAINDASGAPGTMAAAVATACIIATGLALWLYATQGRHGGVARNVILAAVAIYGVNLALTDSAAVFAAPIGRLLGALLLAYAVLRGQMQGLDLKVRFAISKSTVAAVFIAVFFIASEVAQQFFGDRTGSTYIGIGIAGTLVFAMAPIQRAAERLAEKAVPVAKASLTSSPNSPNHAGDEETYRVTVAKYLTDGRMTRDEERHLSRLAARLGIDAERATTLRHAVEDEMEAA